MSLRYNKQNVEARNLLGLVYYELGEVVMAMSHWVMSANYKPKDNPAIRYLQELRDDPKKLEEVNQTARMYNQALVYAKQRDFDLAFIQLRKVIAGNPHFVNGHLLLALLYMEQGREGKARKSLSRVLAIDRTNTTAIHLLRELGETEETIIRIRDDSEELEEGASYYGVFQTEENPSGGRPARKIQPVRPVDKTRDRRVRRYKEVNLAKFSNIYMILGMCIGVLIFYFLVIPVKSKSYQQQVSDVETSYSEQIALKNSIISNLNNQITGLDSRVTELQGENETLNEQVSQLQMQVEHFKNQILDDTTEEGEEGNEGDTEEDDTVGMDVPEDDISNMIDNE
jgi:tetratricopeptide (TPR) repeat protein